MTHHEAQGITTDRWIEFQNQTYRVAEGQTALEAMLAGGADLYFSCRKGTCRSCMLEAISGDPGEKSKQSLPLAFREQNYFLPCLASDPDKVVARVPDKSQCRRRCMIHEKTELAPGVYSVLLEPETVMDWTAGQYLSVLGPDNEARSYSIVSRPEDYFVELHVRHYPTGAVSNWIVAQLECGDWVEVVGPMGDCFYNQELYDRPLLLIGNGTGGSVVTAIAKDALLSGHTAPVTLYRGFRTTTGMLWSDELTNLQAEFPNFSFHLVESENIETDLVTAAFEGIGKLEQHALFLCGAPDMVEAARVAAVGAGVGLDRIKSDPFEDRSPYTPRDAEKIASIKPDPELWSALENGDKLTAILEEFYGLVFEDERLSPFFRKVTKRRLIEKQYSLTADLFKGTALYFGERPFNSHHWMVISDDLFDYRERLFFEVVERHGLPKHLKNRWAAINELFRREIVKPTPRGQWIDGKEYVKPTYEDIEMTVDTVCDGCFEEVRAGSAVRHHLRTGEIFCPACISKASA